MKPWRFLSNVSDTLDAFEAGIILVLWTLCVGYVGVRMVLA
jgi:hypothetical protein